MRRRTITRLAIAGPIALGLALSAATAAQAYAWDFDDINSGAESESVEHSPDWTFTL